VRPTRNAHAQHPHDLFTTASLLWPIVAGMQINEATVVHPITANVLAMSSGRLGAVVAAVVGLTGIVIGGRALARSARARSAGGGGDRRGGAVATVLGLIGMLLGGVVVATSDGGVGTGNGLGGAVVAMVLGLVGVVLGGLAMARVREVA
jgi:Family of unknown function (DUF6223)